MLRELAEELAEQAGMKGSREFAETASVQLERIASKCGNESLDVIEKQGLAAYRVLQNAGDDAGPYLVKAIRAHGEDAMRVAQTSAGRTVLREGSETAIRAVSRHTDAAIPLIRQFGDDSARALVDLSPVNGRRLIQMVEEKAMPAKDVQALLGTIEKNGDKAMDFIWRHRKVLASATFLAAFVSNPEPYLTGAKQLLDAAAGPIVRSVNWNLWVGVVIMLYGVWFLFKHRAQFQRPKSRKDPLP